LVRRMIHEKINIKNGIRVKFNSKSVYFYVFRCIGNLNRLSFLKILNMLAPVIHAILEIDMAIGDPLH